MADDIQQQEGLYREWTPLTAEFIPSDGFLDLNKWNVVFVRRDGDDWEFGATTITRKDVQDLDIEEVLP